MLTQSLHRSIIISFLVMVFVVSLSGCGSSGHTDISPPPPAETPILETILDIDNNLIAPYHATGIFEMQPGKSLELRLRAIHPSFVRVRIDGKALFEVTDSASHPEMDSNGYYSRVAA